MAFSIKQIKAILSENGMPVENLDKTAEEICGRHSADLDSIKEQRDGYKADAEALASTRKELDALKAEVAKHGDYNKLKKEYEDFKAEVSRKETEAAKKSALTKIAKDAGLTEAGIAKAVKYTDLGTIELDEHGEAKDGKALLKSLQEEWGDYVISSRTNGANTQHPPTNSGGSAKTKAEILAIKDTSERQAAWREFLSEQKG